MFAKMLRSRRGFSLMELIVVMAVIAILVAVGAPRFAGYIEQSKLTRLAHDARLVEDACVRYYQDHDSWPRQAVPLDRSVIRGDGGDAVWYTPDLINVSDATDAVDAGFWDRVYDSSDNPDGDIKLYRLDAAALSDYVRLKVEPDNFVLRNPAGKIYMGEPKSNPLLKIRLPYISYDCSDIFNRAIFCGTSLDISHHNTEVYGDVESAGKITGDPVDGEKIEYSERVFASPFFPSDIERTNGTLNVKDNYTDSHSITGDAYYQEITVEPNGTLLIDTGIGDFSRIIRLVVERMNCQGYLKVEGEGRLLLYLINQAELRTPHGYIDGSEGRLIVILKDSATCQLIPDSNFAGYIYGPGAFVGIQSHSTIYGAIIGKHVVRMVGIDGSIHGKVNHCDLQHTDMATLPYPYFYPLPPYHYYDY